MTNFRNVRATILFIYMITLGPQSYETFPTKVGFVFDTSYGWWPGICVWEREREREREREIIHMDELAYGRNKP